jgi:hypothetical protein
MPTTRALFALPIFLLAAAIPAQITYVDADASVNTTFADGSAFAPVLASTAVDNLWEQRPFANGGSIISSNDAGTGSEDCAMLRTRVSGLIPGLPYVVYGYQWSTQNDTAQWRLCMQVDAQQPVGPLPLWHTKGTGTPMSTPLPFDAYASPVTNLGLQYDAAGMETTGHFANAVMVREGNRCLYEIPLGIFVPSPFGDIDVYVDDDPQTGNFYRNWYDGVGYELAPLPVGPGCGNPAPQIEFAGEPVMRRDFSIGVSGAAPNAIAILTFGLSANSWNGLPLPVPLGQFGFPGCFLNVNAQVTMLTTASASGRAALTYNFTGLPSLGLDWQWAVLDAAGAVTMTPGLSSTIHR